MELITKKISGIEKKVKYSILIPTVRANELLLEAVRSALNQSYEDQDITYEVLVLVNNPTEDLSELLQIKDEKLLIYLNNQTIPMIENLNLIVSLSKGNYICYLHDDDLLLPNYLQKINSIITDEIGCVIPARYLQYGSDDDALYGKKAEKKERIKDILGNFLKHTKKNNYLTKVTEDSCIYSFSNCFYAPTCGTVFAKEKFVEIGMFHSKYKYAFDFDTFIKFSQKYNVYILHDYLGIYRVIDSASRKAEVQYEFWQLNNELISNNQNNTFINSYKNELVALNYSFFSQEAKQLIRNKSIKCNRWKLLWVKVYRFIYKYRNGLDATKVYKN